MHILLIIFRLYYSQILKFVHNPRQKNSSLGIYSEGKKKIIAVRKDVTILEYNPEKQGLVQTLKLVK